MRSLAAWTLLGLGLVVGCSSPGRAGDFEGMWTFSVGASTTADCTNPNSPHTVRDITGFRFALAGSMASDLEMSVAGWPDCEDDATIHFDVHGDTATTQDTESCSVLLSQTSSSWAGQTNTYYPFTIEIDASGSIITLAGHNDRSVTTNLGGYTCAETLAGTAKKD